MQPFLRAQTRVQTYVRARSCDVLSVPERLAPSVPVPHLADDTGHPVRLVHRVLFVLARS